MQTTGQFGDGSRKLQVEFVGLFILGAQCESGHCVLRCVAIINLDIQTDQHRQGGAVVALKAERPSGRGDRL